MKAIKSIKFYRNIPFVDQAKDVPLHKRFFFLQKERSIIWLEIPFIGVRIRLKQITIMKEITLTESEDGERFIFSFYVWLFMRLFNLNLKKGWLNQWHNRVYDNYGVIDTLGSDGDTGRFIETYSCELFYRQTIKTRFFTVNLIFN